MGFATGAAGVVSEETRDRSRVTLKGVSGCSGIEADI
jgi:hypothetical protein